MAFQVKRTSGAIDQGNKHRACGASQSWEMEPGTAKGVDGTSGTSPIFKGQVEGLVNTTMPG